MEISIKFEEAISYFKSGCSIKRKNGNVIYFTSNQTNLFCTHDIFQDDWEIMK